MCSPSCYMDETLPLVLHCYTTEWCVVSVTRAAGTRDTAVTGDNAGIRETAGTRDTDRLDILLD